MDERMLRKHVASGGKTECITFAAVTEIKQALEFAASEKCISVAGVTNFLATEEIADSKELFEGPGA